MRKRFQRAVIGVAAAVAFASAIAAAVLLNLSTPSGDHRDDAGARPATGDNAAHPTPAPAPAVHANRAPPATTTTTTTGPSRVAEGADPVPDAEPEDASVTLAERLEAIRRAKRAMALLQVNFTEFGTAFCVDPAGFFVANAHVARRAAEQRNQVTPSNKVNLILDPGERSQRVVEARILRSNFGADLDVAVLQVEPGEALKALELGSTKGLTETAEAAVLTYPAPVRHDDATPTPPDPNVPPPWEYPSLSITTPRVTSLRKANGTLEGIQLDTSFEPAAASSPVLNGRGKVIGVVAPAQAGGKTPYLIPVERVARFLDEPFVIQDRPIPLGEHHKRRTFRMTIVRAGPAWRNAEPPTVEVRVSSGVGPRSWPTVTVPAVPDPSSPGAYMFDVIPIPEPQPTAGNAAAPPPGPRQQQHVNYEIRVIRGGKLLASRAGAFVFEPEQPPPPRRRAARRHRRRPATDRDRGSAARPGSGTDDRPPVCAHRRRDACGGGAIPAPDAEVGRPDRGARPDEREDRAFDPTADRRVPRRRGGRQAVRI